MKGESWKKYGSYHESRKTYLYTENIHIRINTTFPSVQLILAFFPAKMKNFPYIKHPSFMAMVK